MLACVEGRRRMDFLKIYIGELSQGGVGIAWTAAIFLAIETLFPRRGVKVSTLSRLKAIVFWMVYGAVIVLMAHGMTLLWTPLGIKPLIPRLAPAALPVVGVAAAGVVAAYIGDFFYYWCHRAQHRFFWRFHAVHHSVREMNGLTAYHHVSEQLFQFALYSAPLSLLIDSPYSVPILGTLLAFQGNYQHSPTRLNFGRLGRHFVDNRFHRIHHSLEPRHHDRNFALFTTVWDVVFGTAYFPRDDEWPATGVADVPEPQTVVDFLILPFRRRRRVDTGALGDRLADSLQA
jgi:sterol desaturase/sphingolipid hydroxylase (fatty acid hydroxylase superfamily)